MEENNNNQKEFSVDIDKEELKNQTKDTVNQVKETIKNVDFKKDANATKGFILEMIQKPFTTIKDVITEKENRFANAVILMICLMVVSGLGYIIDIAFSKYLDLDFKFLTFVTEVISPLLYVLAFTIAVVLFGGKDKKSITTILSGVTIAYTPRILSMLTSIIYSIVNIRIVGYIDGIVLKTVDFLSLSLLFIAIKGLITPDEDEDKSYRKIVVIAFVAFAILKICAICGIY